jgi:hypothetical protein
MHMQQRCFARTCACTQRHLGLAATRTRRRNESLHISSNQINTRIVCTHVHTITQSPSMKSKIVSRTTRIISLSNKHMKRPNRKVFARDIGGRWEMGNVTHNSNSQHRAWMYRWKPTGVISLPSIRFMGSCTLDSTMKQ